MATPATIRQGSRGDVVKSWQKILGITADGIFGPGTRRSTIEWQKKHGLKADGIVGPNTWTSAKAALVEPDLVIPTIASAPAPVAAPVPPKTVILKRGSRGEQVKAWQRILGVTADGIFGSGTEKATKAWQKQNKLTPDGLVGPATWTKAKSVQTKTASIAQTTAVPPKSFLTPFLPIPEIAPPKPVPTVTSTIRKGSNGEKVKQWQKIIGVKADGKFGTNTHNATIAWQRAHGLKADGIVGDATWAKAKTVQTEKVKVASAVKAKPATVKATKPPKPKPIPARKPVTQSTQSKDVGEPTMKLETAVIKAKVKAMPRWQKILGGAVLATAAFFGIKKATGN